MICPCCGVCVSSGEKYCGGCGSPLAWQCAACQTHNRAGRRFCFECGAAISAPHDRVTRPGSLTGVAERRVLTVLMADLVNSTSLGMRLDPEDLRGAVHAYHRTVADLADKYRGFIARYMGDGVLLYF